MLVHAHGTTIHNAHSTPLGYLNHLLGEQSPEVIFLFLTVHQLIIYCHGATQGWDKTICVSDISEIRTFGCNSNTLKT